MPVLRKLQKKSKRIPKAAVSNTLARGPNHIYYFGSFCLDEAERQLSRNGKTVRVAPKAFDVLLVLIQNKGCLVTKERLLKEVWPDVFVEEANLSVNIAGLRKALDEGETEEQAIETVPKQGYRFVAPVSELVCEKQIERPHFGNGHSDTNGVVRSVAVLPFENEGCGSAGEYLSAGLMESITNSLSRSGDLRVMARHLVYSCHRCHIDPLTVGHKLGVRSVLVGRILRLGDRLIVRTELVDVMNGWQLWGEQYHTKTSDVLIVQQEITAAITERLRIRLLLDEDKPVSCAQPKSNVL
ncbi:MAG TPA: winged helix-turn-helix domain-containing protein [Pyrinomonadaceae bacterium]|nr:winged helix-turn-helix domain-containing protein [Pyrinomonadaceae bacterium]